MFSSFCAITLATFAEATQLPVISSKRTEQLSFQPVPNRMLMLLPAGLGYKPNTGCVATIATDAGCGHSCIQTESVFHMSAADASASPFTKLAAPQKEIVPVPDAGAVQVKVCVNCVPPSNDGVCGELCSRILNCVPSVDGAVKCVPVGSPVVVHVQLIESHKEDARDPTYLCPLS